MMKALCPAAFVLALPVEGQVALWDMQADPPVALAQNPPGSVLPGTCYQLSGKKLTPLQPATACLNYYTSPGDLGALEPFSATGTMAFNDHAPDYALLGLELRGVQGTEECGERETCDTLYLAGFANDSLTAQAMEPTRAGQRVSLTGRKNTPTRLNSAHTVASVPYLRADRRFPDLTGKSQRHRAVGELRFLWQLRPVFERKKGENRQIYRNCALVGL